MQCYCRSKVGRQKSGSALDLRGGRGWGDGGSGDSIPNTQKIGNVAVNSSGSARVSRACASPASDLRRLAETLFYGGAQATCLPLFGNIAEASRLAACAPQAWFVRTYRNLTHAFSTRR